MSRFEEVPTAPAIEVFALSKAYADDTFANKVSLGVGAYRTEDGQPWVLPVVRQAEKNLASDDSLNKEYFPILGMEQFCFQATKLLLGARCEKFVDQRAFGIQTLSGTGALRVGMEFLTRVLGYTTAYASSPTWENHNLIFKLAGVQNVRKYRYWSPEKRGIDMDGLLEDLRQAPPHSVVMLHVCAHNPTGCDPTHEQWERIADVMEERKLFPFFDSAYQGFASGDCDRDAWSVRYFVSRGFELFCAQSFSKNFGLYNERIGNLVVVTNDIKNMSLIKSQMSIIVRGMYSNPPSHGARIVAYVLNMPELYEEWKKEVTVMSSRIIEMRKLLRAALERLGTPGNWEHITSQIGMFSYTGLTEEQCRYLVERFHIYMHHSEALSLCAINKANVDYIAECMFDTVMETSNCKDESL